MKDFGIWVLVGLGVAGIALLTAWGFGAFGGRDVAVAQAPVPEPVAALAKGDGVAGVAPASNTADAPAAAAAQADSSAAAATPTEATETIADVTIWDLIKKGNVYAGRQVRVRGTIISQCMSGCEFGLADDTGTISVQLVGTALEQLVPSGSIGRQAEAVGVPSVGDRPQLVVDDPDNWQLLD